MQTLRARSQRGVSMVEALVAIVVLAIGVLGIAGLNLVSLRSTQDAGGRSAAATLTMEIGEKLRSNGADATNGQFAASADLTNYLVTNGNAIINSAATPPNCFSATANCNPANQIQHDLITWAKSVNDLSLTEPERSRQARLPGGSVAVCFDSSPNDGSPTAPACSNTPNSPVVVKIWWTERARNAADAGGVRFFATSLAL